MRPVLVDKIASVAIQADLGQEIRVSPEIPCEEGVLIAVEVLNNKSRYNTIELTSGRMAEVKKGDVVVGALGHRKALFGYSGHLPTELKPGDIVQLLNLGGVIGICDSINPSHGEPFNCKVLGCVLDFPYLGQRVGVPARVSTEPLKLDVPLDTHGVPVVAIAGTCMNSGKTAAACAIVSRFRHNGLVVDAMKSTGVALRRDILAMEDSGARHIAMFSDFGICATTSKNAPALTRSLLNELSDSRPDAIVFELGDGLLGAYGVEAILRDKDIVDNITAMVLCANDPVGAWGGAKLLREEFGIEPTVISGPATDNQVGIDIINAALQRRGVERDDELGRARRSAANEHRPRVEDGEGERMSKAATIPTIVLGGSGYVAGEFLRLIAGHPELKLGGVVSTSQAGEPVGEDVPAPRTGIPRHAVRLARRRHRTTQHRAALAAAVRRAARRFGRARRSVADGGGDRRRRARRRRRVCRFPVRRRDRLCRSLWPSARDAGAAEGVHLRRARATRAHRDAARGASRLLRDDDAAPDRAARRSRARGRVLRQRGHRQHRRRAHAARYDAPSFAAEQPVRLSGTEAPPRPRGARADQGGDGTRRTTRASCRIRVRSRAAFTRRSSCTRRNGLRKRKSTRRCASIIAAPRSCASTTSRRR